MCHNSTFTIARGLIRQTVRLKCYLPSSRTNLCTSAVTAPINSFSIPHTRDASSVRPVPFYMSYFLPFRAAPRRISPPLPWSRIDFQSRLNYFGMRPITQVPHLALFDNVASSFPLRAPPARPPPPLPLHLKTLAAHSVVFRFFILCHRQSNLCLRGNECAS